MNELSDEESQLIDFLYFQGKPERSFSAENAMPQKTVNNRKMQLLKALRKK